MGGPEGLDGPRPVRNDWAGTAQNEVTTVLTTGYL